MKLARKTKSLKSNIWKFYLFAALAEFSFYTPIIQIFYLANNLSIFKIAILGVVWTVVKMALEIPSSILADKWGRKKTMLLSSFFMALSVFVLIFAKDFILFMLSAGLSAVAYAFLSGTDVAFFYDTLKSIRQEKLFEKLWARRQIYLQIPLIVAFILSGFLYKISPVLPFQISFVFLIFSFLAVLSFKEPKFHKPVEDEGTVFFHFKNAVKTIFKNKQLKFFLLFVLLFSLGTDFSYGFGQIYLNYLSFPIALFGIVYLFKSLVVTSSANIFPALRKRFSYKTLFLVQIILITFIFYIMYFTKNYWIGALGFILIAIPHGLFTISKNGFLHKNIKSHNRATIDSMYSFLIGVMFLIVNPAAGYLSDLFSIKIPFLIIAIILTIYLIYYVFFELN